MKEEQRTNQRILKVDFGEDFVLCSLCFLSLSSFLASLRSIEKEESERAQRERRVTDRRLDLGDVDP